MFGGAPSYVVEKTSRRLFLRVVAGARPVDADDRLVSDDPCIVPGRHLRDFARSDVELAAVPHLHMQSARDLVREVWRLEPVCLRDRLHVVRPLPTGLERQAADGAAADVDDLGSAFVELAGLVR